LHQLKLAYVHIIEPREDALISTDEKMKYIHRRAKESDSLVDDWTSLSSFRRELGGEGGTVLVSVGGYNLDNPFEIVENGDADAIAYGR